MLISCQLPSPKPGDGEFTGLSPEQHALVNKLRASLAGDTDLASLKKNLAELDARADQAPDQARPMLKVQRALLVERIAELQKNKK